MWRRLAHRLRRRVAAEAAARDLNDELQFHLEMEIEHNMRSGLSSDAARAKARREIGAHGEYAGRDPSAGAAPRTPFLESLLRDLRIAFRSLLRTPAFAAVAVVTIALGVGVTTAVFSVVDGVLLRPLPYPAPERLVHVYERSATRDRMSVAGANARDIQTQVHAFSAAYLAVGDATVLGADEPLRARVAGVSREFFRVMGVAPARGRTIGEGEGLPNGPQVAVVSDAFWRTALGADPNFARRTLRVWGTTFPVVGVMPPSFAYPSRVDLWLSDADDNPSRTAHNYSVLVARLAPGVTIAGARAEADALMRRLRALYGKDTDAEGATVVDLHDDLARSTRTTLLILLGAVGFVLLVACVNLASANLARGETRRREYAVRTALGAGRGRIVRQVLTENLLLAVVGGAVGSVVAWGLTRGLVALGTGTLPRYAEVYVDGRVLAFAAAASLLTGIVVGLAPAWQVTRDLRGAISAGGRAGIEGGRLRARGLLIGAEVALAVALLTGAGLLVKSLNTLLGEDIGIHTDGVLAADLSLPDTYRDTARVTAFFDLALPAVRAIPGVTSAGLISSLPIVGSGGNSMFAIDGGTDLPGSTSYRVVDSAYFRTLGIPLTMGRGFSADDRSGAPHVVVINRAMANKFWPGISPLGHRIRFPGMDRHPSLWLTIVGVVADVRGDALDAPASPESFISSAQRPETLARMATLVVRSSLPAGQVATAVAQRVHALDANVLVRSAPLTARIGQSVAPRRFSTVVLSTFAALALALAAIGIYGVLAYVVAQRQREIGVRMALGAERRTVRGMVLLDAMRAVLPGLVVGLVGAFALTRFLRGLLYGVQPTDPTVFAIVALVLTAVALLASWIPARRATRVDPLIAMRAD